MIRNNDAISPYQLAMIIIMGIISAGTFHLVHTVIGSAQNDAWLVIAVYGLLNIGAALLLVNLNTKFPGKTFPEYIQEIIGVIPGKIITFIFLCYIILNMSYEVREFSEVAKMFLLPRTPIEIIMISLILITVYVVRGGVESVARMVEVTFPLLFIPFILILLPGIQNLDFTNIFPLFRNMPEKFVKSAPSMPHAYYGMEYILFYIGFMKKPKKAYRPVALGLLFVTAFYTVITFTCIAAFGAKAAPKYIWPLLSYIRNINIPGLFIERLDGVALTIWVITVYTTIITGYFIVSYSVSKIVGTKEQKQFVMPLIIVLFYFALLPNGLAQLYDWGNMLFTYASTAFMYVIPILLLIIAKLRKLGVKSDEKS